MNTYELSRAWFNFCFNGGNKVKPIHSAIYFFAIEHCNRLGWKKEFGFPTSMVMTAIGVRKYDTYKIALNDLCGWGFIRMIEISRNQYCANIIALPKKGVARGTALDLAIQNLDKQNNNEENDEICSTDLVLSTGVSTGCSTGVSTVSINKPQTSNQVTDISYLSLNTENFKIKKNENEQSGSEIYLSGEHLLAKRLRSKQG